MKNAIVTAILCGIFFVALIAGTVFIAGLAHAAVPVRAIQIYKAGAVPGTDQPIATANLALTGGNFTTIKIPAGQDIAIVAQVGGFPGKVEFYINSKLERTEEGAPYSIAGDDAGHVRAFLPLTTQAFEIRVDAYEKHATAPAATAVTRVKIQLGAASPLPPIPSTKPSATPSQTPSQTPTVAPSSISSHVPSPRPYGPYVYGLNAPNSNTVDGKSVPGSFARGVTLMKGLGVQSVRVWVSIPTWSAPVSQWIADVDSSINAYKDAGFHVLVVLSIQDGSEPASDAQVTSAITQLYNRPAFQRADLWEIGNEPDGASYWKTQNMTTYVQKFVRPAAAVLHSKGRKVAAGALSWMDQGKYKTMITAGLLDSVDYVGIHAYQNDLATLTTRFNQVQSLIGAKPIVVTEWTMRGHTQATTNPKGSEPIPAQRQAWANDDIAIFKYLRDKTYATYYFLTYVTHQQAGGAGIWNSDGTPNEPFYSAFKSYPTVK